MTVPDSFPTDGRLLGIDYGTVRVGLAISTPEQTIASPIEVYQRRSERLDAAYFQQFVKENRIAGLVVGLPMHVNGEEGQKAHEARQFGTWLAATVSRPVIWWDERYTSSVAADLLRDAGVPGRSASSGSTCWRRRFSCNRISTNRSVVANLRQRILTTLHSTPRMSNPSGRRGSAGQRCFAAAAAIRSVAAWRAQLFPGPWSLSMKTFVTAIGSLVLSAVVVAADAPPATLAGWTGSRGTGFRSRGKRRPRSPGWLPREN